MTNPIQTSDVEVGLLPSAGGLRAHWQLFLIEGIVLMVLGAVAIVLPLVASLAIALLLGWLFLIGGGMGLATTMMARSAAGFWWALASAIASIAVGAVLIGWPIGSVISLTFVLTAFLVADGFIMIMFGIEHRRQLSQRWGWFVVNGVLDLLLAGIILAALPASAVWALGLLVGIDMLFGGYSLVASALAARPT